MHQILNIPYIAIEALCEVELLIKLVICYCFMWKWSVGYLLWSHGKLEYWLIVMIWIGNGWLMWSYAMIILIP